MLILFKEIIIKCYAIINQTLITRDG